MQQLSETASGRSLSDDVAIGPCVRAILAALERMSASAGVTHMACSLHLGASFEVDKSGKPLISKRGGRQGCKVGPLVFNVGYALALEGLGK